LSSRFRLFDNYAIFPHKKIIYSLLTSLIPALSPAHTRLHLSTALKWMRGVYWYSGGGVQLGPLGTAATNRPIVPVPGDYDDGEIGGMIGKGNRSTRRKPVPVSLCPPQSPHAARTRTRAAVLGSQRLTAWAAARPWWEACKLWHQLIDHSGRIYSPKKWNLSDYLWKYLSEKLMIYQLVNKFPVLYVTKRLITIVIGSHIWPPPFLQFAPSNSVSLRLISISSS
jgi:hypothetical protein